MPTDPGRCPFCDIIIGAMPAHRLDRYAGCVAFAPLDPATRGHTLVVPRTHAVGIWDVSVEAWADTMRIVRHVAGRLRAEFRPDGINVIQSTGVAATQTVEHLHVHVVPRYAGDAMGPIWPAKEADHDT